MLVFTNLAIDRTNPDYIACMVMNRVLGDGPSARTLPADTWGNPQKPFNFTKGRLKSGAEPQDVYRTFMTGLNGTAMPSYEDIFASPDGENIKDGDAWNLVSFVLSLRKERR